MKYNSLIIIPTYNEAENIEAVIKKVIDLEDKNDILVIDDNSPDGTSKIVENQKNIYYVSGESIKSVEGCIFLEKLKKRFVFFWFYKLLVKNLFVFQRFFLKYQ